MRRADEERLAAWTAETRRIGFVRRNWRVVRYQAGLCVGLLLAGLAADLAGLPPILTTACWIGAAISGVAMLVWMFDRRRFVSSKNS